MTDQEADLIVKRSRSFALLCALILILVTSSFLVSYFGSIIKTDAGAPGSGTDDKTETIIANPAANSKGGKLFKLNCGVCHDPFTDRKLTGPGLGGMKNRIPSEKWFSAWVLNNQKVLKSGDAYAKKIYAENNKADMTVFEGQLSEEEIHEIYLYLTGEAAKPVP